MSDERDQEKPRELGEVWKDRNYKRKPWCVQGSSAVARYRQKQQAAAIGELFLKDRDRKQEEERTLCGSS